MRCTTIQRTESSSRNKSNMSPIVFAIPVFLLAMALELWLARRRGMQVYRTADAVTSLHFGIMSQFVGAVTRVMGLGIYAVTVDAVGIFSWDESNPLTWILALLMYDFLYYWYHRAGHEVHLLWAAHVVHHSSEDYNLSTALRQTSSGFLFGWIFYLPMALLGIPFKVFVIVGLIDLLYQFWVHTELVGRLGWFDRVFVSPSNHRVHHGQNDYCIDKNYGGILIIWDRLFGTFAPERDDEKILYGVRKPLHSWNPLWGNLMIYRAILKTTWQTKGWTNKLMAVFAGPGWQSPELPKHADFLPSHFQRFEVPFEAKVNRGLHVASIAGMLAATASLLYFLIHAQGMTYPQRVLYVTVMILVLVVLSKFWPQRKL